MNNLNWAVEFAKAAKLAEDAPLEPTLTPLGTTRLELTNQLAEAYARQPSWLTQQYIAEAKRRLATLGGNA